ncbi:hypothetical protein Ctob_007031 [Chrysochromulina tobinii]|uniref:Uncharacterized protein n=1 Tax=Chrysochromulina tobinii TaxID=1460289 RepID=A0A0M0JKY4_9EUKA|nr:hypothetical protein Ctob_007031 [Chrysochromulina tobinii]|eukprot:KOO27256.1 hypothetical protein Ctob_007031 [Chrysochromulina sp. CCMP291]
MVGMVEAKYMAQKHGSSLAKWFPGRIESAPDAEGRCNVRPTKRPRTGGGSGGGSAATGGVDGSEGDRMACDAETVYRLCGRVLAKALIEGVACCVDDKLPLFVLEYVMTSDDL